MANLTGLYSWVATVKDHYISHPHPRISRSLRRLDSICETRESMDFSSNRCLTQNFMKSTPSISCSITADSIPQRVRLLLRLCFFLGSRRCTVLTMVSRMELGAC